MTLHSRKELDMNTTVRSSRFTTLRLTFAVCVIGIAALLPSVNYGQAAENVQTAMQLLKAKAGKLGPATIYGEESVAGKNVPVLLFGKTKMNNNFSVVDELQKEKGGVATFFVKSGDEYVRVTTNVVKADGSRAIGTILDPKGKVIEAIGKGDSYYGDADILGKAYVTGYEPIRDAKGQVIGIYFVGYPKAPSSK
jgi:hypothetical protein